MRRGAARIERLSGQGLDLSGFRAEVLHELRSVMSIDAAFFATVDPVTLLFTSAFAEEPLATATEQFLHNEFGQDDVNKFTQLANASDPVASLDHLPQLARGDTLRYREVLAPMGLGDEIRVALVSAGVCWGVLCLHREDAAAGFDESEAAFLRHVAPLVADGLRRAVATSIGGADPRHRRGPGVIVVGADFGVRSINLDARTWLDELEDAELAPGEELPRVIYGAVARALATVGEQAAPSVATRVQSAHGGWIAVHASPLVGEDDVGVVVVLEDANVDEVSSLLLAAHGLTPAQCRVVGLVLQGRSTRAIVDELQISAYTVQEHLHAVFERLGIGSRRELVSALSGRPH
jgi:DNA-binding CsgD family transcriptional regulator